jgi:hypothetical protein
MMYLTASGEPLVCCNENMIMHITHLSSNLRENGKHIKMINVTAMLGRELTLSASLLAI